MAKRVKPPGKQNWTWEEIRLGRKLSSAERKAHRMAKAFGVMEGQGENRRWVPREQNPDGWFWYTATAVVSLIGGLIILVLSNLPK